MTDDGMNEDEDKVAVDAGSVTEASVKAPKPSVILYPGDQLRDRRNGIIQHHYRHSEIPLDKLRAFIIYASGVIEVYCTKLIREEVIAADYQHQAYSYLLEDMSQTHRESLLSQCDLFDDSLCGSLGNFRGLRNKLAHQPHDPIDWDEENVPSKMTLGIDIIDVLYEALRSGDASESLSDHSL